MYMNEEEFKRLYIGEWKEDPIMQECVAFMRYATPAQVREYKREGLFTPAHILEAKRIISNEPKTA